MTEISPSLVELVETTIGTRIVSWQRPELGLTAAERFSIALADGDRVFVKAAVDDDTEAWLRNEHLALASMSAPFQPTVVAFLDRDNERPVLLTEDLSHAYWPASHAGVSWRAGDIERVIDAVAEMSNYRAPPAMRDLAHESPLSYWPAFVEHPAGFLALGLCEHDWLIQFGPALAEAESRLDRSGSALVHGGAWAASQAGNVAYRAITGKLSARKDEPAPPWLVKVFQRLAAINLVWAAGCLGLPEPEGSQDSTIDAN